VSFSGFDFPQPARKRCVARCAVAKEAKLSRMAKNWKYEPLTLRSTGLTGRITNNGKPVKIVIDNYVIAVKIRYVTPNTR
jgi:hypothetical protein